MDFTLVNSIKIGNRFRYARCANEMIFIFLDSARQIIQSHVHEFAFVRENKSIGNKLHLNEHFEKYL